MLESFRQTDKMKANFQMRSSKQMWNRKKITGRITLVIKNVLFKVFMFIQTIGMTIKHRNSS